MSRQAPTRPGAPRKQSGPPSRGGSNNASTKKPQASIEDLLALPAYVDEGDNIELDPALAMAGSVNDEDVTIVKAKFDRFVYPGRDDLGPEYRLFVTFVREGFDEPSKPEEYRYASGQLYGMIAPTSDGNFMRPRPGVMTDRTSTPQPSKKAQCTIFLQSLIDAGLSKERLNTEGVKVLEGLKVHVRRRKVQGMNEDAKPLLLVDYIDGVTKDGRQGSSGQTSQAGTQAAPKSENKPAPATKTKTVAAAATTEVAAAGPSSEVQSLAESALLDVLTAAEGNTISRAQIPTTLIRIDSWREHASRGPILQLLRDEKFINRDDAPWKVDGNNITLG